MPLGWWPDTSHVTRSSTRMATDGRRDSGRDGRNRRILRHPLGHPTRLSMSARTSASVLLQGDRRCPPGEPGQERGAAHDLRRIALADEAGVDRELGVASSEAPERVGDRPDRNRASRSDVDHHRRARQDPGGRRLQEQAIGADDVPHVGEVAPHVRVADPDRGGLAAHDLDDSGREGRHDEVRALTGPDVVERSGHDEPEAVHRRRAPSRRASWASLDSPYGVEGRSGASSRSGRSSARGRSVDLGRAGHEDDRRSWAAGGRRPEGRQSRRR